MTNEQLDFAFAADLPTRPLPTKKRKPKAAPTQAVPAVPTLAEAPVVRLATPVQPRLEGGALETMAQTLEANADYRVLRRLQPRLMWPTHTPGHAICRVVILDTETTGLDHGKDKVMELALVRVDVDLVTGLPVGEVQVYDGLEDPGMQIPTEIQEITGITPAMVQGQKLDEARVLALLEGVDLVFAHNAGFDRPFCEARLARFSELPWACSFADIPWRAQGRRSSKLESLAQELGLFYDAHRAEMDCHALLAVLAAPLPKAAHTGLAQLVEQAARPSYRLMATHAPFDAKDKLKARGYRWSAEQKVWSTRIADSQLLEAEFAWLKENAYHQRSAVLQFEKLDAHTRYASRPGEMLYHQL